MCATHRCRISAVSASINTFKFKSSSSKPNWTVSGGVLISHGCEATNSLDICTSQTHVPRWHEEISLAMGCQSICYFTLPTTSTKFTPRGGQIRCSTQRNDNGSHAKRSVVNAQSTLSVEDSALTDCTLVMSGSIAEV